jgi:Uma2 family endonuclease
MVQIPTKRLTFEEYLTYNDGTENRYELFDGELVLMTPTVGHTLIIKFLEKKFDAEIERLALAWIALRDTGIRTGAKVSRVPDLSVFTTEQASLLINRPFA